MPNRVVSDFPVGVCLGGCVCVCVHVHIFSKSASSQKAFTRTSFLFLFSVSFFSLLHNSFHNCASS